VRGGDELHLTPASLRAQELLCYLVIEGQAGKILPCAQVAAELWPRSAPEQGQANLRRWLHWLSEWSHRLPGACQLFEVDQEGLSLDAGAALHVDVLDFEQLLERAAISEQRGRLPEAASTLVAAISAYRGNLLPASQNGWVVAQRLRLRRAYLEALERVVCILQEMHQNRLALAYARQHLN
jgi:two-component SAPR family response regulator